MEKGADNCSGERMKFDFQISTLSSFSLNFISTISLSYTLSYFHFDDINFYFILPLNIPCSIYPPLTWIWNSLHELAYIPLFTLISCLHLISFSFPQYFSVIIPPYVQGSILSSPDMRFNWNNAQEWANLLLFAVHSTLSSFLLWAARRDGGMLHDESRLPGTSPPRQ